MRQLVVILASLAVAVLAATASAATPAVPRPVFVLDGGGWGHGVGMSQWGAYGQAVKGRAYSDILSTYYPGTTLEQADASHCARARRAGREGAPGVVQERVPHRGRHRRSPRDRRRGDDARRRAWRLSVDGVRTKLAGPLTISSVGSFPARCCRAPATAAG